MSATPREQWVATLRSGEFTQGRGVLESREGALCCLGVACIVAERNGVSVERTAAGRLAGTDLNRQPSVAAWLGMEPRCCHVLIDMNDDELATFEQIANYIEDRGKRDV